MESGDGGKGSPIAQGCSFRTPWVVVGMVAWTGVFYGIVERVGRAKPEKSNWHMAGRKSQRLIEDDFLVRTHDFVGTAGGIERCGGG